MKTFSHHPARFPNKRNNYLDSSLKICDADYRLQMPREYSNSQVDRAGQILSGRVPWPQDPAEWDQFIDQPAAIFADWRALHALALDHASSVLGAMSGLTPGSPPLIGERLKRWPSIRKKLKEVPTMQLTTMQDIAGCRAIVESVDRVKAIKQAFEDAHRVSLQHGIELVPTMDQGLHRDPKARWVPRCSLGF